jgi:hypothetical protein
MTATIAAAIILVLLPAVLGWLFLLRALVAVFLGIRDRRRVDSVVRAYSRMAKRVKDKPLSEFQRRQLLHEFNRKRGVGNAEIVELHRKGHA